MEQKNVLIAVVAMGALIPMAGVVMMVALLGADDGDGAVDAAPAPQPPSAEPMEFEEPMELSLPEVDVPETLTVEGPLDPEHVARGFHRHRRELLMCWEQHSGEPGVSGTLGWTISPEGRVTEVTVDGWDSAELAGCLSERVHRWVFHSPEDGEVQVTRQVEFPLE